MGYAKLDDRLPHHRKVRALAPRLVLAAYGLYVASVQFAQRDDTDGWIREADLLVIMPTAPRAQIRALTEELVRVRLWDLGLEAGGWKIHDYLEWNLSAEERKVGALANRARSARYRDRLRDASVTRDETRDETRDQRVSHRAVTGPTPLLSSPKKKEPPPTSPSGGDPPDDLSITRCGPDRTEQFKTLVEGVAQRVGLPP